ncbi:hypothetical protein DdX_12963 [Ditylenchus destructor]|uniref:Uncharacterized protein n=1 Tax=Ditylenchus destructor TaxID=166010 RepID=A0AAD4MTQ4_9BILA|nr:hypothetical protein DdX_12963 [Ditylenchus destructor]
MVLYSPEFVYMTPVSETEAENKVDQLAKDNTSLEISSEKAYAELLRTHATVLLLKSQFDEKYNRFYSEARAHRIAQDIKNSALLERDRAKDIFDQTKQHLEYADAYYEIANESAKDPLNYLSYDLDIYQVSNDTKIAGLNKEHYAAAQNRAITKAAIDKKMRRAELIPYRDNLDAKKITWQDKDRVFKDAEANEKRAMEDLERSRIEMDNSEKSLKEVKKEENR